MFRRRSSSDTSRDELLGQKVKNIIPEGFAERLIADDTRTAAEALAQQIGTGLELNGRRKDGSEFPIEIMLSPLESDEGILVTAAIRDITRAQGKGRTSTEEKIGGALDQDGGGTEALERRTAAICVCRIPRSSGTVAHGGQFYPAPGPTLHRAVGYGCR